MSVAVEILSELQRRGVSIRAEGDELKLKPAHGLDGTLLERVKAHKPEILAAIRKRPATCAETCYEIEPDRWIHRSWDGCTTEPTPRPMEAARQTECEHCESAGQCSCPACTLQRTETSVPCLMCQPLKRQAWLAATRAENQKSKEEELSSCTH
jgi:hypothetical protein